MKNNAKTYSPQGYTGTEQNLYLTVFYPKYRNLDPNEPFPIEVRNANKGINTPQDYVDYVNKKANSKRRPQLSPDEDKALAKVSAELGVDKDSLYNLINFESNWDPQAKNVPTLQKDGTMSKGSSARGLIQFMDKTARSGDAGEHFSAAPVASNAPPLSDEPTTNATTPK
jgi:soluble lytic murein transglycosylase-like protein